MISEATPNQSSFTQAWQCQGHPHGGAQRTLSPGSFQGTSSGGFKLGSSRISLAGPWACHAGLQLQMLKKPLLVCLICNFNRILYEKNATASNQKGHQRNRQQWSNKRKKGDTLPEMMGMQSMDLASHLLQLLF